jgi:hypothetical protein
LPASPNIAGRSFWRRCYSTTRYEKEWGLERCETSTIDPACCAVKRAHDLSDAAASLHERIAHRFGSNMVYGAAEVILSSNRPAPRPSAGLPGRSAAAVHGRDWLPT